MTNLILCGGAGTRLWPISRQSLPKQFYPLIEGKSLFEETVLRNQKTSQRFFVASNAVQMSLAREQMARCGVTEFGALVEPMGRNTAPAIALVCQTLPPHELVFVTPSDHRMNNEEDYQRAVRRASELASEGFLVTFGIRPSYPETGFGYIEADGEVVRSFREKPDIKTAQGYCDSGRYFWNSGMFVFQAGVFLQELKAHAPDVLAACQAVSTLSPTLAQMESIPSISIDYAVMEKSKKVRVVPCDPGWSDLGSFEALAEELSGGDRENSVLGTSNPIFVNSGDNLVVGSGRKVALIDVDELMVIDTPDALLIVRKGSGQKVKDVVAALKKEGSTLLG
jgi:mannose-1-phosphate guanylyltransferase